MRSILIPWSVFLLQTSRCTIKKQVELFIMQVPVLTLFRCLKEEEEKGLAFSRLNIHLIILTLFLSDQVLINDALKSHGGLYEVMFTAKLAWLA